MPLSRVGRRREREDRGVLLGLTHAAGVAHEGGQFLQQRLEAVHRGAVVERAPGDFL